MKEKVEMLTTSDFAEREGVNYRTALKWLKADRVPGARYVETPTGGYWQIPATAVQHVNRPERGWKKGVKRKSKSTKKSAVRKSGK